MIQLCSRFVIPRIRVYRVPKGTAGTLVTARLIGRLIGEGAKDFYVRQKAIQIFRDHGVRPKDRAGEVLALFNWVRRNIRYTRDIFRTELLHSARRMLELAPPERLRELQEQMTRDIAIDGPALRAWRAAHHEQR